MKRIVGVSGDRETVLENSEQTESQGDRFHTVNAETVTEAIAWRKLIFTTSSVAHYGTADFEGAVYRGC